MVSLDRSTTKLFFFALGILSYAICVFYVSESPRILPHGGSQDWSHSQPVYAPPALDREIPEEKSEPASSCRLKKVGRLKLYALNY